MRSRTLALAAVAVCAAAAFGWTAVADAAAPGQQLGLARLEAASATPLRVQLDPASGGVSWLRGSFAPLAAAPARDAFLFLDTHRAAFGVTAPRAQFRILGRLHDTVADTNHVVLQQTAAGLPVYGCRLAFHYDRAGRLQTVNGDYLPPATLTVPSTTPSVSAAAAVATATAAAARLAAPSTAGALAPLGRAATARPALARRPVAKLVLYPDLSDTLRLAYVVDVTSASPPSEWHIVVDARRDVVLDRESGLEAAVVKGSGTDLTGRRVGLNLIHPATAVFKMVDQSRYMFRHHSSVHPYSKYRGSIEIRDARHRMSGFQPVMSRSNPTL
ncbi:MAG TPA: hypothetical protein VK576_11615, partial [Thermoleophilia bacterium]|nr:hypothetical protein [Thermoleophilia bacterium]